MSALAALALALPGLPEDAPQPPAVAASASAVPARVARWRPLVREASARFGVPIAWIERVMQAESAGLTSMAGRPITSHAGAIGLMQLMPATWAELRAAHGLGDDPYDPRDNILAGTAYLRRMYDQFGYPGLFAAYNAGPARYAAFLAGRQRLPAETRAYLAAVTGDGARAAAALPAAPEVAAAASTTLFVIRRPAPLRANQAPAATGSLPTNVAAPASPSGLFVIRSQP